ncbi:MAG: flagellar basal body rod protein FlgB [Terracidiphilus sp.]|jgi:flagellar basal-body rod protein FlgB
MTQTTPLISTLESYLSLTTRREQAISSNMANVDTPGYHTRDIDFSSELQRATSGVLSQSEDGTGSVQINPVVRDVPGLLERPDGNNVSLDREGLLMSETQLQYQIGIQLIKHQFHQILSAISGGGS